MRSLLPLLLGGASIAAGSSAAAAIVGQSYDAVVLGTGLSESLVAASLASQGKRVLQLDGSGSTGGESPSLSLAQLSARLLGDDAAVETKLGNPNEYAVDLTPKVLLASGAELQLLVRNGLWANMDFRRVHRSFIYRRRPDGVPDVHRVVTTKEDLVKTRMFPALEKAKAVQLFMWLDQFDEDDVGTYTAGKLNKKKLPLLKMSALSFFKFWELSPTTAELIAQGLGRFSGSYKSLKKLSAIELVREMKAYKEAFKTFPHMTSPYVYPVGGLGASLAQATAKVLESNGGAALPNEGVREILYDKTGRACGVATEAGDVHADCVIAAPSHAGTYAEEYYQVVRLYAVLGHTPNQCKDARSCNLVLPGVHCGRKHPIHLFSSGSVHSVSPSGKYVAVLAARIEGDTNGLSALQVAKRELAAALPLLKPAKKLIASISPVCGPALDASSTPPRLHVLHSCDESHAFTGVAAEAARVLELLAAEELV